MKVLSNATTLYKHSFHQMAVAIVVMSVESIKIVILCVCASQGVNCPNFGQFAMKT